MQRVTTRSHAPFGAAAPRHAKVVVPYEGMWGHRALRENFLEFCMGACEKRGEGGLFMTGFAWKYTALGPGGRGILWVERMSGMDAVVVALISGAVTLLGVLIANSRSQAVTETKLDELTREVREHNNFARRMPVVEEQIKDLNRRLSALERR